MNNTDGSHSTLPTRYSVRCTDRERERTITAESPMEAATAFLGQRMATLRLNCWTPDGRQWNYDASVKVGLGPFRMGRDAVKSVAVIVTIA
jgi:hypothetical protein